MKIDANGTVSEACARGDFGAGHTLDEAKNERLTVGFREGTDCLEDSVGFGAGVGRGTKRGRQLLGFGGVGFLVECVVRFNAAVKIRGAVAGNGGEPAWEFGYFAERVEARQGLEEDVLDQVIDVGIRHAGEQNTVDHAGVAIVEEAKGGAVTLPGSEDERVVGAAGFRRSVHGCETGMGGSKFKDCRHVASMEKRKRLLG
jgi:hypothetical protein